MVIHFLIIAAGPFIHLFIHIFFIACHIFRIFDVFVLLRQILIIRVDFILFIILTILINFLNLLIIYLLIIINFMRIIVLLNITVLSAKLLFGYFTFQRYSVIFLFRFSMRIVVHNNLRLGATLFC
jgi:hypothetical protein